MFIVTLQNQTSIKDANTTRRSIWDAINNSNISVENHVHSYTTKSNINKNIDSTDLSIKNSAHSINHRRSHSHNPKKKAGNEHDSLTRKSYVHNAPLVHTDITSNNKMDIFFFR